MSDFQTPQIIIRPLDEYNQKLLANLHPSNWVNPQPAPIYDLVILGGGSIGSAIAHHLTSLNIGLKVALVEKYLMGGDYLNSGCIPTKSLLRSAQAVRELQQAQELGVMVPGLLPVDFPQVMTRMRRLRERISHHYAIARWQKSGVDVFLGEGRFINQDYIGVGEIKLRYHKAAIATGTKPHRPNIPGLEVGSYLTKENVFSLIQSPPTLAVIGGGATGCEIAQIFHRLGVKVSLFDRSPVLNCENEDAAKILAETFKREGIRLFKNTQVLRVEKHAQGKTIYYNLQGKEEYCTVDEIFLATGQTANVETLNLNAVNIKYSSRRGIQINDYLQTTNPRIFAAGNVCMDGNFRDAATTIAQILVKNAFFSPLGIGRRKFSDVVIPWVTYTDPEIAHLGLCESDAVSQGIDISVIQIAMSSLDMAITDGQEEGFVRIIHRRGSDEIIGATIVAHEAREMVSLLATAMNNQIGLKKLAQVIHPQTTQTAAIKKAADAYCRTLITPRSQKLWQWLAKFS